MDDRDIIFRDRLVAFMSALRDDMQNPVLRKRIGVVANELSRQAGTRGWADLKARSDGPTYDSLLTLFQKQAQQAARLKDNHGLQTFEALALSLIARHQAQDDLAKGVELLDGFIAGCEKLARQMGLAMLPPRRTRAR